MPDADPRDWIPRFVKYAHQAIVNFVIRSDGRVSADIGQFIGCHRIVDTRKGSYDKQYRTARGVAERRAIIEIRDRRDISREKGHHAYTNGT
jgi:hypothetical protein